ncbi:MAG: protein kinase [Pyrinomonadaceae bacterium]
MEKYWQRVKEIFTGAIPLDGEARDEYIDRQCKGDEKLRAEVETLLASYDSSDGFMDSPAIGEIADEIVDPALGLGGSLKQYRIIRELGTGGMGEVYLAEDRHLGRKVAIKILNKSFSRDDQNLRRFLREAKTASSLNHPGIVIVHEVGISDGIHYLVTEYIEGETLYNYVSSRNSSFTEITDLAIQICKALAVAHAAGIIHRDIKPENIMVREDGLLKILDFGLAKRTRVSKSDVHLNAPTHEIVSTQKGMILGTAAYMSPEQARGKTVGSQTDIWSLGVVLFQLLTKKLPFSGETTSDVIAAILKNDPPPLLDFVANIPEGLESLIRKSLRKDPGKRYQSADEMLEDLKNVQDLLKPGSHPIPADSTAQLESDQKKITDYEPTAVTDNRSNGFFRSVGGYVSQGVKKAALAHIWLSLIVAAAVFGLIGMITWSYFGPVQQISEPAAKAVFTKITNERIPSPLSTISPDGKLIAYIGQSDGKQSLRVRQVAVDGSVEIVPAAEVEFGGLTFSENGNHIYYTLVGENNESKLYEISTLGGSPRLLEKSLSRHTAAVSPDGKSFAYIENGKSLIVGELGNNERRKITESKAGEFWYAIAWHPNGRSIAGAIRNDATDSARLINISLSDGSITEIRSKPFKIVDQLSWLKDASGLILNGRDDHTSPLQIWHLSYPDGRTERITNDTNNYFGVSLTADGRSLLTSKMESDRSLWLAGEGHQNPGQKISIKTSKNEGLMGVSFLPDERILYTVSSVKGSNIWSSKLDGTESRQLTFGEHTNYFPKISPDGKRIIFVSDKTGNTDIWQMNVDGSDTKPVTTTPEHESFPSLTPDGNFVVFQRSDDKNNVHIWKRDLTTGAEIQISDSTAIRPVASSDGKLIASSYGAGSDTAPPTLAVYSIVGGKPLRNLDLPRVVRSSFFRWTTDMKGLIYVDRSGGADNLWIQPLDQSPPRKITDFSLGDIAAFELSADQSEILLSRGEQFYDVIMISNFR